MHLASKAELRSMEPQPPSDGGNPLVELIPEKPPDTRGDCTTSDSGAIDSDRALQVGAETTLSN